MEPLTPQSRQIRVFVSSTFKDMRAERDYLVKFIFPQLRLLCESRSVTWGDVDLRWGVTEEQKAEGQVLPICLEEIERCRPFFIGLLGERYGWVPDQIPPNLVEREHWLEQHAQRSVTELEIIHGVLREPGMHDHGFFYFRDPTFLDRLPAGENQADFECENETAQRKLADLKRKLRQAHAQKVCRLRENFRDPRELGQWVLEDFTSLINTLFPEAQKPGWLQREAAEHDAFALSRTGVYVGRQEYFDRLDLLAAGEGPPLVVLGESGSGKSALLANWAVQHRRAHPDDLVLMHFLGASAQSSSWTAIIQRIMGEIKDRLNFKEEIPDKAEALRSNLFDWLSRAAAQLGQTPQTGIASRIRKLLGRRQARPTKPRGRVLLILDGLNQLEDRDAAPDLVWLPPGMPPNVRLVVSTLPGRALDEIKRREWAELSLSPLDVEERRRLIAGILARHAKSLSPGRLDRLASNPSCANPLFLRLVLDELCLFGEHERLDERISHYLEAASPRDLYAKVIARWRLDYGGQSSMVEDTLSLLWAARRGLSEAELLGILGTQSGPLPRAEWSPLYLAMSAALVSRAGLLNFAHDYLRIAVMDTCLTSESHRQAARLRLAGYFQRQPPGIRQSEELPWQLCQAKQWSQLAEYLSQPFSLLILSEEARFDTYTFWAEIEANSPLRLVEVYRKFIEQPGLLEANAISRLQILLRNTGHLDESLRVFERTSHILGLDPNFQAQQAWTLHLTGKSKEALALLKQSEITSRLILDRKNLAINLGTQAAIVRYLGDEDKALQLHEQEEKLYRELGFLEGISTSLANQAILLQGKDNERAMLLVQEAERIERQRGDLYGLQSSLAIKADLLFLRGEVDEALRQFAEQESICRKIGQDEGLATSLTRRAEILLSQGHVEQAATLCRQVESIWGAMNRPAGHQVVLGLKGRILKAQGHLDQAMEMFLKQEQLCRTINFPGGIETSLGAQAEILEKRGKIDEALVRYKQAEQVARQINGADLHVWLGRQGKIKFDRGDLDGAMLLFQEQEKIARSSGLIVSLEVTTGFQGLILFQRGLLDEALQRLEEAQGYSRQSKDISNLQDWLGAAGLVLRQKGQYAQAMEKFLEQEKVCVETNNKTGLCMAYLEQGNTQHGWGKPAEALENHAKAEALSRQVGDLSLMRTALGNQARIKYERGNLDEAMILYQQQERSAREAGDNDHIAYSVGGQGAIFAQRGLLDDALRLYGEAEKICRQTKNQGGLQAWLGNAGVVLRQKGRDAEAMEKFFEQERVCSASNDQPGLCKALLEQGNTHLSLGKPAEALESMQKAETLSRRVGDLPGLRSVLAGKGNILKQAGRLEDAQAAFKEQEKFCRQANDVDGLQVSLGAQSQIALQRGQANIALALAKEQERLCRENQLQKGISASLVHQGQVLMSTGNFVEAKRLYAESIQASRVENDQANLQSRLGDLGWVHYMCSEMDAATQCFAEQEGISRQIGNQWGLQASLGGQGAVARFRGQSAEALRLFEQQQQICRQIGNLRDLQGSLNNQGLIHWGNGDFKRAMALFESIEQTCRTMGNLEVLWHTLYNQAEILFRHLGNSAAARKKVSEAVDILLQTGLEPDWLKRCMDLQREIGD
jgi:tetratricopeptide (TPR) repeat protein